MENTKIPFLVGCAVRTVAVNAKDSGSSGDVRTAHPTQENGISAISTSLIILDKYERRYVEFRA